MRSSQAQSAIWQGRTCRLGTDVLCRADLDRADADRSDVDEQAQLDANRPIQGMDKSEGYFNHLTKISKYQHTTATTFSIDQEKERSRRGEQRFVKSVDATSRQDPGKVVIDFVVGVVVFVTVVVELLSRLSLRGVDLNGENGMLVMVVMCVLIVVVLLLH
ncbi:hypothetical protein Sjap_023929 [Stephania japonica]|uniref:Uncharacterized protein n=1 Tax=Stephania japonica TaxID=461633 RepID=A0AAP0EHA8_9MAGN